VLAITGSAIGFGLYESSRADREQILRDEARNQEAHALAATQKLADAGKKLAGLSEQVRFFQANATTLEAKKEYFVAFIDKLKRAINESKNPKDREHFEEELAKYLKDLEQVNAQIAENKAQLGRLQDEIITAEATVSRQATAASPLPQESNPSPAQESTLPAQEPQSKCAQCNKKWDDCEDAARVWSDVCHDDGRQRCDERFKKDIDACNRKFKACQDSCRASEDQSSKAILESSEKSNATEGLHLEQKR